MYQEVYPPVLPSPEEMAYPCAGSSHGDTPSSPARCMDEEDCEDSRRFSVPQPPDSNLKSASQSLIIIPYCPGPQPMDQEVYPSVLPPPADMPYPSVEPSYSAPAGRMYEVFDSIAGIAPEPERPQYYTNWRMNDEDYGDAVVPSRSADYTPSGSSDMDNDSDPPAGVFMEQSSMRASRPHVDPAAIPPLPSCPSPRSFTGSNGDDFRVHIHQPSPPAANIPPPGSEIAQPGMTEVLQPGMHPLSQTVVEGATPWVIIAPSPGMQPCMRHSRHSSDHSPPSNNPPSRMHYDPSRSFHRSRSSTPSSRRHHIQVLHSPQQPAYVIMPPLQGSSPMQGQMSMSGEMLIPSVSTMPIHNPPIIIAHSRRSRSSSGRRHDSQSLSLRHSTDYEDRPRRSRPRYRSPHRHRTRSSSPHSHRTRYRSQSPARHHLIRTGAEGPLHDPNTIITHPLSGRQYSHSRSMSSRLMNASMRSRTQASPRAEAIPHLHSPILVPTQPTRSTASIERCDVDVTAAP